MIQIRHRAVSLLMIAVLCFIPVINAGMVDIQVYKGELRIIVHERQTRNTLTMRYRSTTREVVRIVVDGLTLTNMRTKQVINLHDQSAGLGNLIDHEGHWNTDITYSDLDLGWDNYRIEGRLTLYLIGSQRTSDISAYLEAKADKRPEDSSIDWGMDQ